MYEEEIHFQNCYSKCLGRFDPVTLTFDLVTPKSIGFLCCLGPGLRKVVLELLIGNKKGTDGQTDRPTDMCKAICLLSFEGWQKIMIHITICLTSDQHCLHQPYLPSEHWSITGTNNCHSHTMNIESYFIIQYLTFVLYL